MMKVKKTESEGSGASSSTDKLGETANDKPPPIPVVQNSSSKAAVIKKSSVVRCQVCKKKIGIVARYQCRCGLMFCSTHRYPEAHACSFDYKTEGRNKIRENNPVITAQKIQEI